MQAIFKIKHGLILFFLIGGFVACKKDYNDNCNVIVGGTTFSKQVVFSGTVKESCSGVPLSNIPVSIFAHGRFEMVYPHCRPGSVEDKRQIIYVKTDANGKFSINQNITLSNVDEIDFYEVYVNATYVGQYYNPNILADIDSLSGYLYQVKSLDSLSYKNIFLLAFPKVIFTNCKTLYSDTSKYLFLDLYPLRNNSLTTVGNDIDIVTHDSYHFTAIYGDTIKSFYGLIPNNWYGYKYWKKSGSIVTQYNDSVFIDCSPIHWIAL